jgi:hypothetical protein
MLKNLKDIIQAKINFLIEDKELEQTQANLRSSDEDLEAALGQWGLSSRLGYYPMSAMIKPFETSFNIRIKGDKIPISWKGMDTVIDRENKVFSWDALLWLDPDTQKNIKNKKPQDTYKFKVVRIIDDSGNSNEPKDEYIIFQGKEINVEDKRMGGEIVPSLRKDKKYFVNWYSEIMSLEDADVVGDQESQEKPDVPVPEEFLKGNRNMQLIHLSKTFLPKGQDLWSLLNLKDGYPLKGGFFDASLGQGKVDPKKYLTNEYEKIIKSDGFKSKVSKNDWFKSVKDSQNVITWVRNTRKNIEGFFKALNKAYPEFELGQRAKAKTKKPGEAGKAMGTPGAITSSVSKKYNILTEGSLGSMADKAGFKESIFMKNLPTFIELLSMMYFSISKKKLEYNVEAVLKACSEYGCKGGSGGKKYDKVKSDDYEIQEVVKKTMSLLLEQNEKDNINMELIFDSIEVAGMKRGEEDLGGHEERFKNTLNTLKKGGSGKSGADKFKIDDSSLEKIKKEAEKKGVSSTELDSLMNLLDGGVGKVVVEYDKGTNIIRLKIGKTDAGRTVWINVPVKDNGADVTVALERLYTGSKSVVNCSIAVAVPQRPLVTGGIKVDIKLV